MFSFFSRKPTVAESTPLPASPSPPPEAGNRQLRTPSPSVDVAMDDPAAAASTSKALPPPTPSPGPSNAGIADVDVAPPATIAELLDLADALPPKTLHSYVTDRLASLKEQQQGGEGDDASAPILAFFSELRPPPQLHCARCHKGFFEVDNGDRSCLVPHDDDSAEVERAGVGKTQTVYWCCEQTVEGEGDLGPPDGWCFEGLHTTDRKRARFRADSTPSHDKLASCERKRCFNPRTSPPSSSASSIASPAPPKRKRSTRKRTRPTEEEEEESTELEAPAPATSITVTRPQPSPSVKGKSPNPKGKQKAKEPVESESISAPLPAKKRRRKNTDTAYKPSASADEEGGDSDVEMTDSPVRRKRGRPRKNLLTPSKAEESMAEDKPIAYTPGSGSSPLTKSKMLAHRKSASSMSASVAFSETASTVSKTGVKGSMRTKDGARVPASAAKGKGKGKALKEVVSSSIPGEE